MQQLVKIVLDAVFGVGLLTLALSMGVVEAKSLRSMNSHGLESTENVTNKTTNALGVLSLEAAISRSLKLNPQLEALSLERNARNYETRQTGRLPNPELSVEVENVAGSGDYSEADQAETTVSISQLVELGGKRKQRQVLGGLEQALAERDYEIGRADIIAETTERFSAVLSFQKRVSLAEEQAALVTSLMNAVTERISAGKSADIEMQHFKPLAAKAKLQKARAIGKLEAARHALATMWGSNIPNFDRAQGTFEKVNTPPEWENLVALLKKSPALIRQKDVLQRDGAILKLAHAERIPDMTLTLGVKNSQESEENALVAGVSIPLPVFHSNQDAIGAATSRLSKSKSMERAVQLRLQAELAALWQELRSSYLEVSTLREEILPAAHDTFDAIKFGYESGKFGILAVLDAQRSFFDAKDRYIDSLTAYHRSSSRLQRLVGQNIFIKGDPLALTKYQRGDS